MVSGHRTGLKLCLTRPVFAVDDMAKFNAWRILVAGSLLRESSWKARLAGHPVVRDGTRGHVGWAHFCGPRGTLKAGTYGIIVS